jgi:hypothetical protein
MAIFRCVGYSFSYASRQTHTQGNNKNYEGKQHRNKCTGTNGKLAECDHVKKRQRTKKKKKKSYTPEDGHVGRKPTQ